MRYIFDLGCCLCYKLYTLCRTIVVSNLALIIVVTSAVWSFVNRRVDLPSMIKGDMGSRCCKCGQGNSDKNEKGRRDHHKMTESGNFESEQSRLVNDLINKNTDLEGDKLRLEEKVEVLERELEQKKNEFSEMFGKDIEIRAKDNFNNTGDAVQPIDISKRSEDIFDGEWRRVMVNLFKHDEQFGLGFLSEILEECQQFCKVTAGKQLAVFTNPCSSSTQCDVSEILASQELHNLYKIRRKIGQQQSTKDEVIKYFYDSIMEREKVKTFLENFKINPPEPSIEMSDHEPGETNETDNKLEAESECGSEKDDTDKISDQGSDIVPKSDPLESLDVYIKHCTDMCWQAAISDPPVEFLFDVVGRHIDDIKSKFYAYPSKLCVSGGELDTVKLVVWPAVVKTCSNGREVLIANKKGCVLLYNSKED